MSLTYSTISTWEVPPTIQAVGLGGWAHTAHWVQYVFSTAYLQSTSLTSRRTQEGYAPVVVTPTASMSEYI